MEDNSAHQPLKELSNKQPLEQSGSEGSDSKLFSLPRKHLAILVGLLCLVALGSAAFLLTNHFKKDSNLTNLFRNDLLRFPSPIPTPTLQEPLEGIEETLGWNVYSNSQYGYSIKYPLDWSATITLQEDPKILEYVVFNPLTATKAGELSVTLTYTTRTYKEVLDSDHQPGETITVSTVSATRKLKEDSQRNVLISVALPHNSNTFILLGKEKYKDIYNQMLSTFLFENR